MKLESKTNFECGLQTGHINKFRHFCTSLLIFAGDFSKWTAISVVVFEREQNKFLLRFHFWGKNVHGTHCGFRSRNFELLTDP